MKLRILATSVVIIAMTGSQVMAGDQTHSKSVSGAYSNSGSNGNSIVFGGSKSAASAIAPGLFASGLSCSGSASAGGAGSGWGISLGLTKEDKDCNTRENAKTVLGLTGDRDATKEVLCDLTQIRTAFSRIGRPCLADISKNVASTAPQAPKTISFKTMAECREYARNRKNVTCR
jgi:hypothetical protein